MKDQVNKAILKYSQKQLDALNPKSKRKNKKPEKEVERAVLARLRALGFSLDVVESKAHRSMSGNYFTQSVKSGVTDLIGCSPQGIGCFIELKAPGKRSTLKEHQRDYILEKAKRGAFAVCVDSDDLCVSYWDTFLKERRLSVQNAYRFLESVLP